MSLISETDVVPSAPLPFALHALQVAIKNNAFLPPAKREGGGEKFPLFSLLPKKAKELNLPPPRPPPTGRVTRNF